MQDASYMRRNQGPSDRYAGALCVTPELSLFPAGGVNFNLRGVLVSVRAIYRDNMGCKLLGEIGAVLGFLKQFEVVCLASQVTASCR